MRVRRSFWGLLLALMFVAVQAAAFMHVATHGFEDHKHHGKACEIYEYCQHLVLADGPAAIIVPLFMALVMLPVARWYSLAAVALVAASLPRAPPVSA
ncbi:MAG: hypothetical protein GC129_05570 [Proteobacteria bacterium]|nr:hypothetical protein [Pseudomonadota bacterium]